VVQNCQQCWQLLKVAAALVALRLGRRSTAGAERVAVTVFTGKFPGGLGPPGLGTTR
jgi:cytochrome c peroxidase